MCDLQLELGKSADINWAQTVVAQYHYLHTRVDPRARPMVYVVRLFGERVGVVMAGIPHATKNKGWWGSNSLPTQWQVVDLCRIWLDPRIQQGGSYAQYVPGFHDRKGTWRPTTATWVIHQVLQRIQRDRIALWPPVYLDQPYHIRLVISYHDPRFHRGIIYQESGAKPMYTDEMTGQPKPGSSGKYGWCWRLPEPVWQWNEIEILRPRSLRLI